MSYMEVRRPQRVSKSKFKPTFKYGTAFKKWHKKLLYATTLHKISGSVCSHSLFLQVLAEHSAAPKAEVITADT